MMEYVDGTTLKRAVSNPLPFDEASATIRRIAESQRFIHERRIAHFDLNPNNVMVRADSSVVLIDFGFAKRYDSSTEMQLTSNTIAGAGHRNSKTDMARFVGMARSTISTEMESIAFARDLMNRKFIRKDLA